MVNYQLLNVAGYRFNICQAGQNVYDQLSYRYKENFPDIEITRVGAQLDVDIVQNKALITINGYVYNTSVISNRLFVPNATLSMLKSRQNQVGMLAFNDVESITKTPIIPAMISNDTIYTLYQRAIIQFPTPVNKPILILGGYMIFEDPNYFYRISDDTFVLKLELTPYMERLFETQRYRDIFKDLGIAASTVNPSAIDSIQATSDATVTKYLTMFNSFLVDVGNRTLTTDKIYLQRSNVPCNFRTETLPNMPFIVGYGKLAEYAYRKNIDTLYTVYTHDAYYNNHIFSYLPSSEIVIYNDHRDPRTTYYLTPGFFLSVNIV